MLHVAAVREGSLTAGLSPNNNERTEIFLAGCKIAREGNPCRGCFNEDLWNDIGYQILAPEEVFSDVENANNRYVTIVGGEPLDQYKALVKLLKLMYDYHVVLITHYTIAKVDKDFPEIMPLVDTIIDGPYDATKRIFNNEDEPEGVKNVIGSSNQIMWTKKNKTDIKWYQVNWKRNVNLLNKAYGLEI